VPAGVNAVEDRFPFEWNNAAFTISSVMAAAPKIKASFVEPMLLLRTEVLPEGPNWLIELKLDGYRALAIKTAGSVQLRSRNNNDFGRRYPQLVKALASMPDEPSLTVKSSPLMNPAGLRSILFKTTGPPRLRSFSTPLTSWCLPAAAC